MKKQKQPYCVFCGEDLTRNPDYMPMGPVKNKVGRPKTEFTCRPCFEARLIINGKPYKQ